MEIPKEFYYIVGFLVVVNFGSIVSFLTMGAKKAYQSGYEKAELEFKIKNVDNKADRAHERIDKIEHKVYK